MDMCVYRASQNCAFHVAAETDVIISTLRMGNAHRVLLNYRAFI
jgi:hypothetical protein